MSPSSDVIDPELALERAGGNQELACQLYQMLQDELPNYQATIKRHHEEGNHQALLEVVHKLNGSATYCGVPALKSAAASLEGELKQGDGPDYTKGVVTLMDEIVRLQQMPELQF